MIEKNILLTSIFTCHQTGSERWRMVSTLIVQLDQEIHHKSLCEIRYILHLEFFVVEYDVR